MDQSDRKYIIACKADEMGSGEPELGQILIKAYINALLEQPSRPTAIVFYNSGVKLVAEGSGVEEALSALEKEGIELLLCGTCVEYYGLREQLKAGTISNMYHIAQILADTDHIIYP